MITEQEEIKLISQGVLTECPFCNISLVGDRITEGVESRFSHHLKQIHVMASGPYPDNYKCPSCNSEWGMNKWKEFFAVTDDDKHICYLNPSLIIKQKLDFEKVSLIKKLHVLKARVIEIMENSSTKSALRNAADTVTQIEFMLQGAWGFAKDERFHRWWLVPKCTCPRVDNEERYGTMYTIKNADCLIHGV